MDNVQEAMGMQMEMQPAETVELEACLARVQAYASALEDRCHRLWSYVPGNEGHTDPAVSLLANQLGVTDSDLNRIS
jgi:hypothetical protein